MKEHKKPEIFCKKCNALLKLDEANVMDLFYWCDAPYSRCQNTSTIRVIILGYDPFDYRDQGELW